MRHFFYVQFIFWLTIYTSVCKSGEGVDSYKLLVISVATNATDGYNRFVESLDYYGYEYEIYGLGQIWKGGDVQNTVGGGQKVNILKNSIAKYADSNNLILLFADSYDTVFNADPEAVVKTFLKMDASIVFGAEDFCWPNKQLASYYPEVPQNEKRFLNSGGFMGFAPFIYGMIESAEINDDSDDQLFYTQYYLRMLSDDKIKILLDTKAQIFQNLNGADDEIELRYVNEEAIIYNKRTESVPMIIHGNGPSKIFLNRLSNYLAGSWKLNFGCQKCDDNTFDLTTLNRNTWPNVLLGIFIELPTPFLEEFFQKITRLTYPKEKLEIFIHNAVEYHEELVRKIEEKMKTEYRSVTVIHPNDGISEINARQSAIDLARKHRSDLIFFVDSVSHIDDDETLLFLIGLNKSVIAPKLIQPGQLFSNFWGDINSQGYYKRSDDYVEIVSNKKIGVWNVPHISMCCLIKTEVFDNPKVSFQHESLDPDMALTKSLRDNGIFMWVSNLHNYGHLVDRENFNTSLVYPELYELFSNLEDWKRRYLHPRFYDYVNEKPIAYEEWQAKYLKNNCSEDDQTFCIAEPCTDVFWFPLLSERFASEIITTVNNTNLWSFGKHEDPRIPGGYENVPTDDIHMTQINWLDHWLRFLKIFIQPVQQRLFLGYYTDTPRAPLSFIVRYDPKIQDSLRPHHDASTYTLDIALNKAGVDYQDGGVRFIRYNCTMTDTRLGWTLMFPGRLTHLHEGLRITNGTRYIFVSFIDP